MIFDLDGVITDTAKYHFQAWKMVADEEGIYFDERINERLKGVSRSDSLNIIMERANRTYSPDEPVALASKKNRAYVDMLNSLTPRDILPGIVDLLAELRGAISRPPCAPPARTPIGFLNVWSSSTCLMS